MMLKSCYWGALKNTAEDLEWTSIEASDKDCSEVSQVSAEIHGQVDKAGGHFEHFIR